jgi:hypothetical protein
VGIARLVMTDRLVSLTFVSFVFCGLGETKPKETFVGAININDRMTPLTPWAFNHNQTYGFQLLRSEIY